MYCKKCGSALLENADFCTNCGEKVSDFNSQNVNTINNPINTMQDTGNAIGEVNSNPVIIDTVNTVEGDNSNPVIIDTVNTVEGVNPNNGAPNTGNNIGVGNQINNGINNQSNQNKKGNKKIVFIILAVIGVLLIIPIILVVIVFSLISASSEKLVCKSSEGNITLYYNKSSINGYKASGINYNLDQQKEIASQMGIDEYLSEFSTWFSSNTTGSCTINGKKVEHKSNESNKNAKSEITDAKTKVVGDDKYGYITIPNNWNEFHDIDENDSLQYSKANVYIVSLNVLDKKLSAKEYASNYLASKQNSEEVTDVTGSTVNIGKNKEYTAYQVYMFYPVDSTYLITYWFEAEDGKVHYISLEGPQELTDMKLKDFLFIPESFSLKSN